MKRLCRINWNKNPGAYNVWPASLYGLLQFHAISAVIFLNFSSLWACILFYILIVYYFPYFFNNMSRELSSFL
jgi:hypothetical protein